MPATTVSLEVLIAVEYTASHQTAEELATNLHRNVESAAGRGLLTDGAHRTASSQRINVLSLSAAERDLDEKEVSDWISSQVEGGHMSLEDIPSLMARYAFASPAAMRQEFAERMGL